MHRTISIRPTQQGSQAIMLRLAALPFKDAGRPPPMQTDRSEITEAWSPRAKPAWANVWHLWKVYIPRRTITGKLVCGKVWRRHDGRRWIYKRFVEFDSDI
jgi:hypothetical protein